MPKRYAIERAVYGTLVVRCDLGRTSKAKAQKLARGWMERLDASRRPGSIVRVLSRELGWPPHDEQIVGAFRFDASNGRIIHA